MSRTQGRLNSDVGYPDTQFFISAEDLAFTSGTGTLTRNAAGDFSLNIAASATVILTANLSKLLFRYGVQDYVFEQFGSAQAGGSQGLPVGGYTTQVTANASAGSNVSVTVLSTANFTAGRAVTAGTQKTFIVSITDSTHMVLASLASTLSSGAFISENLFTTPAGVTGPAPYTGTSQFTPLTSARPKGIKIREIYPWYLISAVNLTTNTISITQNLAANGSANTVSTLLASAANGLATTFATNPYLTPIMLATPAYLTNKFQSTNIEWDVTTPSGGTARIYGIFIDAEVNYN